MTKIKISYKEPFKTFDTQHLTYCSPEPKTFWKVLKHLGFWKNGMSLS